MSLQSNLDREIRIIVENPFLSEREKAQEIAELERDARDYDRQEINDDRDYRNQYR